MTQINQGCFLIIEDQVSMAKLFESELKKLTSRPIYICHSLYEVKKLLKTNINVEVCLSDLHLPDSLDGETIKLLKQHNITTVVITGSFKEETRQQMFKNKVADYVIKDNLSSIHYAIRTVYRLFKNKKRSVWVLSSEESKNSAKLIGMLRIHRFQVFLFENSQQLLDSLKTNPPCLILLDNIDSLEGDSTELVKNIRQDHSQNQLPIISCEESDNISLAIKLMKYGVNDFFNTDFSSEEFYVRVNQNIEQSEHFTKIELLAQTDGMTGLYNRRYFFERSIPQLKQLKEKGQYFFTLMADIDHFKNVNDTYGHQKGDEAICYVATTIKNIFNSYLVARFGGEEFCVFGSLQDASEIEVLSEQLRKTIEAESKIKTGVHFTISLGISFSGNDIEELIKKSDKALYQAKETGRNKVCTEF